MTETQAEYVVQTSEPVEPEPLKRRVPCEVYSRIVGYLRPVRNWNQAKQAEFAARKTFDKAVGDADKAVGAAARNNLGD